MRRPRRVGDTSGFISSGKFQQFFERTGRCVHACVRIAGPLEALRHRDEKDFSAVFFRRNTVQVRNPGGLWDESFAVVAADVKAAVDAVTTGLKWFASEAKSAIAWIDRSVPGAQTALALLFQAADAAAAALETQASSGLADVVAGAVQDAGGTIANLISASGLDLAGKAALTAADVATVSAAQSIAHNAISVATAKLLGQAAAAAPKAAVSASAPGT